MAVDGTLRVASPGEGKLYAFEADGGLKWVVPTEQGEANVLAVGDDGTTYLGAADDLIAYDATGKQTAKYAGPCDLPIIDAAGNLYDTCSGFVVKLDAALNLVWSMSLPFDPAQAVNDSLIIGPGGTLFVSLDTENSSQPDGGPPDMVIGLVP
jgi:outer membrane protein assembly factor BamB